MKINGNTRLQKEANGVVGFWKRWWNVQKKQNLDSNHTSCWNPGCKDKVEMWVWRCNGSPATKSRYHLPQKKPQYKNHTHCKSTGSTAKQIGVEMDRISFDWPKANCPNVLYATFCTTSKFQFSQLQSGATINNNERHELRKERKFQLAICQPPNLNTKCQHMLELTKCPHDISYHSVFF